MEWGHASVEWSLQVLNGVIPVQNRVCNEVMKACELAVGYHLGLE